LKKRKKRLMEENIDPCAQCRAKRERCLSGGEKLGGRILEKHGKKEGGKNLGQNAHGTKAWRGIVKNARHPEKRETT